MKRWGIDASTDWICLRLRSNAIGHEPEESGVAMRRKDIMSRGDAAGTKQKGRFCKLAVSFLIEENVSSKKWLLLFGRVIMFKSIFIIDI